MATKKTGGDAGNGQGAAGADGAGKTAGAEDAAGGGVELRVERQPNAEAMFANFMVAVAGRKMAAHQPAAEIADTAERLTAEWLARREKFAGT